MIRSIFSALSGVRAAMQRQNVSANNVANVLSEGYQARRVVQTEVQQGGTQVAVEVPDSPAPPLWQQAQALGVQTAPSDVDLAQEMTQQIISLRSLQANLIPIRTSDEMLEDVMDSLS